MDKKIRKLYPVIYKKDLIGAKIRFLDFNIKGYTPDMTQAYSKACNVLEDEINRRIKNKINIPKPTQIHGYELEKDETMTLIAVDVPRGTEGEK